MRIEAKEYTKLNNYKVSIIVPVYNVERYLKNCMNTLVHQTLDDIEIIAVNDGSPDNSLEILMQFQADYPHKVKVFTTENKGVSHARNYGLDLAKGDYILFVDSDDYIAFNMCELLYKKAVQDKNDIVVCSRYNIYEEKKSSLISQKETELNLISQNFNVQDQSFEYAHISPFPWDKIFKRDFIGDDRFPENMRFEDLVFSYRLICRAKSIGVLKKPLYYYRRTTKTGFLNSFSEFSFDIIKAFQMLFDYLEENHYMEQLREEAIYICARHFLFRYPAFFKKVNRGKLSLKISLIEATQKFLDERAPDWRNNHYLHYTAAPEITKKLALYTDKKKLIREVKKQEFIPVKLKKFQKKWRRLRKILRNKFIKFWKTKKKFRLLYKRLKRIKLFKLPMSYRYTKQFLKLSVVENQIFLESKHGTDIGGNIFSFLQELSKPAYQEFYVTLAILEKNRVTYQTLLERYQIQNVNFVVLKTKAYLAALASAKYLITDTSFPPYFIKKHNQVYLNTWHGTPLKAMGKRVPKREYALGNVQRNFLISDYLLYQNEFSRYIFLKDYMLENIYSGKIMLSGYPRNTAFFRTERYLQIREECGIHELQVIAYMPTWRGLLHKKDSKKQLKLLQEYFFKIDSLLSDTQLFYVKLHPFVKDKINYNEFLHIKPFPEHYETYDFLSASDLLVTDYSSIMFDYAVSKKKIILFTYDRDEYLTDRGMYLDINQLELPIADTAEELIAEINRPSFDYPEFFRTYCKYDKKNCTKKICQTIFLQKPATGLVLESLPQKKEKILIYLNKLPRKNRLDDLIQTLNALDTAKYDYYISFPAKKFKKRSGALAKLKDEIGYLPLQSGLNARMSEKFASILALKFGIKTRYTTKKLRALTKREKKKHYGKVKFVFLFTYQSWTDWIKMRIT